MKTTHQANALAHIARESQDPNSDGWTNARCKEIGKRTAEALERKGLVEIRRSARTIVQYGWHADRIEAEIEVRLAGKALAAWNNHLAARS